MGAPPEAEDYVMAGASHRGQREVNEDRFCVSPRAGFAVVADGFGGVCDGVLAAALAVEVLRQHIEEVQSGPRGGLGPAPDLEVGLTLASRVILETARAQDLAPPDRASAIERALDPAARQVLEMHRGYKTKGLVFELKMGAAVVACLARGGDLAIAHAGDARAYRVPARGSVDGEAERLTEDHSLRNQLIEHGRLADMFPGAERVLVSALGVSGQLPVRVRTLQPAPGDIYVLCSDGVWEMVKEREIDSVVRELGHDVEAAAARLVDLAITRGGEDNSTAVVVRCPKAGGGAT
jgi:protein phosphatase